MPGVRVRKLQVAGEVPRLRRMEQLRGGTPGGALAREGAPAEPGTGNGGKAQALRPRGHGRGRAHQLRHRRVRPRPRRGDRARLHGAHRGRTRHREEHAAVASGAPAGPSPADRALRLGRRVGETDQAARGAAWLEGGRDVPHGGDVPRAHPRRGRAAQARGPGGGLRADRLLLEVSLRPRQHQPGPRGGDPAPLPGQGPRPHHLPHRPRHERRQSGGAQVARAHRGHRPLLRGRETAAPPHRARGEEPLWGGVGDGGLRDDGHGPQRRARTPRPSSWPSAWRARPGRPWSRPWRARGPCWWRCRPSCRPRPSARPGA